MNEQEWISWGCVLNYQSYGFMVLFCLYVAKSDQILISLRSAGPDDWLLILRAIIVSDGPLKGKKGLEAFGGTESLWRTPQVTHPYLCISFYTLQAFKNRGLISPGPTDPISQFQEPGSSFRLPLILCNTGFQMEVCDTPMLQGLPMGFSSTHHF